MIFAYHSLGPTDKVTLDSLVPQGLGSVSFNLIPNGNEEIFNVSSGSKITYPKQLTQLFCHYTANQAKEMWENRALIED